jgi:DNA-nicking Smr family endonuclease
VRPHRARPTSAAALRAPAGPPSAAAGLIVNPKDPAFRTGPPPSVRKPPVPTPKTIPEEIEPRRKRRISMSREPISGRLDLHGLTQDQARAAVLNFIRRAHDEGSRAVLIITGKGAMGDGVLRRCTPEWLADPAIRPLIAGLSPAERHHGGEGALYVALKRRHR